jgi:hypothetical protein
LSGVRHGFLPPQLKTKTKQIISKKAKNNNYILLKNPKSFEEK